MSAYKNSRYPTGVQGLLPWCGILLAVVLVGGWFFVDFFTRFGEELERQELLVTAATAAASFDGGELQSLNGDTDNQSALIFTRAREKLQRLRAAVPRSRFVYLMALRNGDVVFLADAEPVNSPDYSSPGEVYAEASPAMRRVFATATAATEGPLPDHWGEWVSGLAPILDPVTGDVAAIIGIDISAEHWQKTVAHFRWLGLGVSAGFSAVVLFFGFLAYRQYRLSAKLTAANHIAEEAQAVAHVGSWSFDVQDRTLSWSAEHYRIYGVDPATFQPTYEQVVARTHPDDRASFEREYGRAVESHSVFELDKRIVMHDGSTRFVHDRGRTYYDAKGRPVRSIGTVQDITDRRIAEERMVFTNTLLTTQMETSPDGMLVVDENGGIISFNRRFADMWQVPIDLLHGGSDAPVLAAVTSAAKDPEKFLARVQYLYQHPEEAGRDELETKDGRFIDRHTAALRGDTGQYLGRVWFFRDITERKRAEEEMRASEERLRIVFSSVSDGIFITDMKTGKFIEINQPGCAMFGYSRDELVGRDIVALSSDVFPNTQIRATELLGKARADGPQTLEWHCRTKEGRLFWVEASLRYTAFGNREVVLATLRDISERKNAHAQIERMARYDGLTGLANRGVFMEVVQQAIAHAGRGGRTFAVLYLDLDHFKDVNDTLGHPVGDELLKSVAARLLSNARETDIVARFGGDEFAVIAADLNEPADAAILADALIKSLREPFSIQGNDIRTGASLGISVFGPEEPDAETLLSHADVALYRAKSEGRGAYRFFTDSMDAEVRTRVGLTTELREAIAAGQLFLLYQPKVDTETGRITGVEALARWRHPERGVLGPDIFIPIAEKSGLIVALGHWALLEACRQAKEWLDAGLAPVGVAVNLSAVQVKRPLELEGDIAAILAKTGLPSEMLELELTETVLMEASREHNDFLLRLRQRGIKLAIDDFGTGYSSLDYLRRFPVDRIKIAQTFVRQIVTVAGSAAIVKATIGLARELGIAVIAEGVATEGELALLRSWGCREVQGFYFARPLLPEDLAPLLRCGTIRQPQAVSARAAA